jgi:Flp pilus assembly protein TadG
MLAFKQNQTSRRRGTSAVEMALICPLLAAMVLAAVDFARFAYNYIAVVNAARAGASYGIMNNYTTSSYSTWTSNITQAARDEITPQVGASNAANLSVSVATSTDANNLKRVQVTASYPFTMLVNWQWTGLQLPHSVTMQQTVDMRLIR